MFLGMWTREKLRYGTTIVGRLRVTLARQTANGGNFIIGLVCVVKNHRFFRPRERRPKKNQKNTFHYQKTLEKHRVTFVLIPHVTHFAQISFQKGSYNSLICFTP
jgi:hypothetical protein